MVTSSKELAPPPEPPDTEALLEVFRKVVPDEYYNIVRGDKSWALFRGIAAALARVADAGANSIQARFHLPSGYQTHPPASSESKATGTITLSRSANLDMAIAVNSGEMRIEGPGSRVYLNAAPIYWPAGDSSDREVLFECEVGGFNGNLDWLADDDDTLELEQFEIQNQDKDRSNVGGSVTGITAESVEVRDSGRPTMFVHEDLGLYLRVDNSAHTENVGKIQKIIAFEPALGAEFPAGSELYPNRLGLQLYVPKTPAAVQVRDASASTWDDVWPEVENGEGFSAYPTVPASSDALYIGAENKFRGLCFALEAADADWTVVWEYWNGSTWVAVSNLDDLTDGFTIDAELKASSTVSWQVPADWAASDPTSIGTDFYYVRARLSAVSDFDAHPELSWLSVLEYSPLTSETRTLTWSVLDFASLGVSISEVGLISGGRDNDLYLLGKDRGMFQQHGETDDEFRARITTPPDAISPNAINRKINHILSAYQKTGSAIDPGNGLTGFFYDVPASLAPEIACAYDMYGAGDAFPEDPWILPLSQDEAYGFGLIVVPRLGLGDFGMFYDDGPIYYDQTAGEYTGPAYGGWLDGYATIDAAIYSAIYTSVLPILGAGIRIDLVLDPAQD